MDRKVTKMDSNLTKLMIQPDLIRRDCGGWLAVSPFNSGLSIGVTAPTEIEAIDKFRSAFTRWLEIIRDTKRAVGT